MLDVHWSDDRLVSDLVNDPDSTDDEAMAAESIEPLEHECGA